MHVDKELDDAGLFIAAISYARQHEQVRPSGLAWAALLERYGHKVIVFETLSMV